MRIKFTKSQWERISEISGNIGIVTFGSIFIPAVLNQVDVVKILLGVLISIGLWYISVIFARKQ